MECAARVGEEKGYTAGFLWTTLVISLLQSAVIFDIWLLCTLWVDEYQ